MQKTQPTSPASGRSEFKLYSLLPERFLRMGEGLGMRVIKIYKELQMSQKTALITGASSGIGKELATIFAKNHYRIVLVARSKNVLDTFAAELSTQYAIKTTVIAKDLSQPNAAKEIFAELQTQQIAVDTLVNNAGFGTHGYFSDSELTETLGMITVNISALTELTHLLLPAMLKQQHGKILNIASIAAFQAGPQLAVYSATKAYVLSFSEALAHELKNSGVTVTALCPGATATGFQNRANMHGIFFMENKLTVMSAKCVAEIGFNALQRGKSIAISGWLNKVMAFSTRLSPRRMATAIAGKLMS